MGCLATGVPQRQAAGRLGSGVKGRPRSAKIPLGFGGISRLGESFYSAAGFSLRWTSNWRSSSFEVRLAGAVKRAKAR
jgi:hypothetical protein